MNRLIPLFALAVGCSNAAAPPSLEPGAGITIDDATHTVSVDPAKVPMLPNCDSQQLVQRGANGQWVCASSAPNADKLGSKAAAEYALKSDTAANAAKLGGKDASEYALASGTVANASALEGHAAADFLGVNAVAADSAKLEGHSAKEFLAADGKAVNSARLDGHPASDFLGATGTATDSSKLAGLTPDHYVLQDPKTHVIDLEGDIRAGDNRVVVSNEFCLADRTGECAKKAVAQTSLEGVFCGATAATPGVLEVSEPGTTVRAPGYRAAKLLCEKADGCSVRAHMCTAAELARSEALRMTIVASGWYANGEQDCGRWSIKDASGAVWNAYNGSVSASCGTSRSIACCD